MTEAIICHTDMTEVTGWTKDDNWHTVDLSPFLQHPDPKIVCLQKEGWLIGAKPVGSTILEGRVVHTFLSGLWCSCLVALNEDNEIQLHGSSVLDKVYITAEFGGDGVYAFDDYQALTIAGDAWYDYDLTSLIESVGDDNWSPGGQFSVLLYTHTKKNGHWSYRINGGVYSITNSEEYATSHIGCVQLDENDIWENYIKKIDGVPASFVYVVGFIKNFVSHDAALESWTGKNEWQTHDITTCNKAGGGTKDYPYGKIALIKLRNWYDSPPPFDVYARAIGSTNSIWKIRGVGGRELFIKLNSEQEFEIYRNNDVTVDYHVKGFYLDLDFLNLSGTIQELNKKEGEILELNEKSGSIVELNAKSGSIVETSGFHKATENFGAEAVGTSGTDIDWVDAATLPNSCTCTIEASFGGHKNVLKLTHDGGAPDPHITHNMTQANSGTIELYWGQHDATDEVRWRLYEDATAIIYLKMVGDKFKWNDRSRRS